MSSPMITGAADAVTGSSGELFSVDVDVATEVTSPCRARTARAASAIAAPSGDPS